MFYLLTFDFDFADSYPTVVLLGWQAWATLSSLPLLPVSLFPSFFLIGFVLFTSARESENLKEKSLCTLAEAEQSHKSAYR